MERLKAKMVYRTKDEFFFQTEDNQKLGFKEDILGEKIGYLKKDTPVDIFLFKGKPISVELPIKIILEVKDAPPATKGDTVQGALKEVTLETGITARVPLFVETGDRVEIDTRTGDYVRRA